MQRLEFSGARLISCIGWKHNLEPESLSSGTLFCGNLSSIISGSLILIISTKNTSPTYYTCQKGSWVTSQKSKELINKSSLFFIKAFVASNHELQILWYVYPRHNISVSPVPLNAGTEVHWAPSSPGSGASQTLRAPSRAAHSREYPPG